MISKNISQSEALSSDWLMLCYFFHRSSTLGHKKHHSERRRKKEKSTPSAARRSCNFSLPGTIVRKIDQSIESRECLRFYSLREKIARLSSLPDKNIALSRPLHCVARSRFPQIESGLRVCTHEKPVSGFEFEIFRDGVFFFSTRLVGRQGILSMELLRYSSLFLMCGCFVP
ncbi:hypothetical protein CEXT_98641 [Caerostris extrusa]|uniref:Uncharacterized protein n=1 Tax=Caerostris extrusa TaxID=172846 RepID=A0AAV4XJ43_CAEEX|nr:hypothetical protein CEXT_98641 [Caerostris extrusa]